MTVIHAKCFMMFTRMVELPAKCVSLMHKMQHTTLCNPRVRLSDLFYKFCLVSNYEQRIIEKLYFSQRKHISKVTRVFLYVE